MDEGMLLMLEWVYEISANTKQWVWLNVSSSPQIIVEQKMLLWKLTHLVNTQQAQTGAVYNAICIQYVFYYSQL